MIAMRSAALLAVLCHAEPFLKAAGATVKYVLGSSVETAAKLRAAVGRAELDVT